MNQMIEVKPFVLMSLDGLLALRVIIDDKDQWVLEALYAGVSGFQTILDGLEHEMKPITDAVFEAVRDAGDNFKYQTSAPRCDKPDPGNATVVRLKQLRKEWAGSNPAFIIFTDAVLQGMVSSRPKTIEELRKVKGIRADFVAKYGNEVIQILSQS